MDAESIITCAAEVLGGAGFLTFGVGFLWGRILKGKTEGEERLETINLAKALETANQSAKAWQNAADLKDTDIAEMRVLMAQLKNEVSELRGKVQTYENLLGGKEASPAMVGLFNTMTDTITAAFALGMQPIREALDKIEQNTHGQRVTRPQVKHD